MPKNKDQIRRLVRICAELKKNKSFNAKSFAREWAKDNNDSSCCGKTIQRDIETLKREHDIPIRYNREEKKYYTPHNVWKFECPIWEDNELLAAILGAKIAEGILPSPLRENIRDAVNILLTENNPDFLDTAQIDSLIISSGLQVTIDPEIFKVIFDAWSKRLCVEITYTDKAGKTSNRLIEPHVLAYLEYSWLISGVCRLRDERRTFAVHRISNAVLTEESFEPDMKLIEEVKNGLPFAVTPIKDIKIQCDDSILHLVKGRPLHKDQKITENKDASFTISVPSMTDFELLKWIFENNGKAKLLEPLTFKKRIAQTAKTILDSHQ